MAGSSSWDDIHQMGTVLDSSRPRKLDDKVLVLMPIILKSLKTSPDNTSEDPTPARLICDVVVVQD